MIDMTFVPQPPLSNFIACLWFQEDYLPPHSRERVLPDGSVEIVINLREDRLAIAGANGKSSFEQGCGSLVYGPRTEIFLIDTTAATSILGVHFKSGGAFPFFRIPADEIHNCIFPLNLFWGSQTEDLRDRLMNTQSVIEKFYLFEAFLKTQLIRHPSRHPAVDYALCRLQSPLSTGKIADIVEQCGVSSRRLSQVFREQVGMTPKAFYRLQRFQIALQIINRGEDISWIDIALSCGYFDQSHFVHDFKVFSGLTPVEYQLQTGKRPGHVPITA